MQSIRLLLVDDHAVVRTGLKTFLEGQDNFLVVGEAKTGREACELVESLDPDVVVMDITMPDMDGITAAREISKIRPNCKVLALTVHKDKQYFLKMMAAGGVGYISKQSAAEELVDAINTVSQGFVYFQPVMSKWLLEDYRELCLGSKSDFPRSPDAFDLQSDPEANNLSNREYQVIKLVADGLTSPQIAALLEISPRTVSRHRERIMNKLNIHSTAGLVKFAIRTGIIDLSQ